MPVKPGPLRVLFICTENSARSQMAEALLRLKGREAFEVASAGSDPAREINPLTVEVLAELGIEWDGKPKGFEVVSRMQWDFVITVCDRARESCPSFPNQPVYAHWRVADPAVASGGPGERRAAFSAALQDLRQRIDLMLAVPVEKLAIDAYPVQFAPAVPVAGR